MDEKALEANYSWNCTLESIWDRLKKNNPGDPHFEKLRLLAELKTADIQAKAAGKTAQYTGLLAAVTVLLGIYNLYLLALMRR